MSNRSDVRCAVPERDEAGLALIITVGLLTLLAVAGSVFVRFSIGLRVRTGGELDRTQARLLARSGLQYASARLTQTTEIPKTQTAENQADDWTYRDGAGFPLEKSLNPSYAQAEPYQDVVPNGKYDEGGDPYADLDHSGRFDSWSGRLRSRHGTIGGTFALKILSESGKINVNGGWLDGGNRNGNLVPDHRDVDEVRNRRYVLLLDNLGQVVNVSTTSRDSNALQSGAASRLGDLIKKRPYGGYQSMSQIQGTLASLDCEADWPKVKDFLTVVETERAPFSVGGKNEYCLGLPWPIIQRLEAEMRPLVNLGIASPEVRQSLVLGLGLNPLPTACVHWIDPDLASKTSDYLSQSFKSWYDFYAKLHRDNPSVDPESAGYEGASAGQNFGSPLNYAATCSWANVVFGNLLADEIGGHTVANNTNATLYLPDPPMSWHTYDIPRAAAPGPPHFHHILKMGPFGYYPVDGTVIPLVLDRLEGGRPLPSGSCFTGLGTQIGALYVGGTLEVTLIPREVSAVSIDCRGRSKTGAGRPLASAAASSRIGFGTVVSARTQAEFENLPGFSDHGWYAVVGRPSKDRTQSDPQFSIDSLPPAAYVDSYRQAHPGTSLYSPFWGTVRLADRSGYRQGEKFYVPAWDIDQPLRPPVDPAYFRSGFKFEDNFRDISGPSDFVYEWNPSVELTITPAVLTSLEAVFRGERGESYVCSAAPAVSAPGTYTWPGGKGFPLDDGHGNVVRGTVELWTTGRPGGTVARRLGMYWTTGSTTQLPDLYIRGRVQAPTYETTYSFAPAVIDVNDHLSDTLVVGDWHHLVVAFDSGAEPTMIGYLDGRPDPFLTNTDWSAKAIAGDPRWILGQEDHYGSTVVGGKALVNPISADRGRGHDSGSQADELRLYDRVLAPGEALARAALSRYWTEERFPQSDWPPAAVERVGRVPSFTSPFYVFNRPTALEGARWDGFVPQLIREAIDGGADPSQASPFPSAEQPPVSSDSLPLPDVGGARQGFKEVARGLVERGVVPAVPLISSGSQAPPIKVEIMCYPGSDPKGPYRAVPFPVEFWRSGGGWADFKEMWRSAYGSEPIPYFRGYRYKVWMDCSGVDGFNGETPVFDSISMAFKTGARLLDFREE